MSFVHSLTPYSGTVVCLHLFLHLVTVHDMTETSSDPQVGLQAAPQTGRGALLAGGLAAILASTCCLVPLILVMLGFSGAWSGNLTVLEPAYVSTVDSGDLPRLPIHRKKSA
jgi:hypothetical protein